MKRNGPFSRAEIRQFIKQARANCKRWRLRGGHLCMNEEVKDRCPSCRAKHILRAIGRQVPHKIPKWLREQNEKYEILKKERKLQWQELKNRDVKNK